MALEKSDLSGKIIVVLDDSENTRNSLKSSLESLGATVYTSGHIQRGESILSGLMTSGTPPALVIADTRLPGNYGFEVLRRVQTSVAPSIVPILLISRGYSKFAVDRASLYGVSCYLTKPVMISDVTHFAIETIKRTPVAKPSVALAPVHEIKNSA